MGMADVTRPHFCFSFFSSILLSHLPSLSELRSRGDPFDAWFATQTVREINTKQNTLCSHALGILPFRRLSTMMRVETPQTLCNQLNVSKENN